MAKVFKDFSQTQLNVEGANVGNKRTVASVATTPTTLKASKLTTITTIAPSTSTAFARIKKRRLTVSHYEILQTADNTFSATNNAYAHVAATTSTTIAATSVEDVSQHAQLTTYAAIVAQHLRFVALQIASTFCAPAIFRCNSTTKMSTASSAQKPQHGTLNEKKKHKEELTQHVTMPLKRKPLSGRTLQKLLLQLSISSHLDTRSLFYLLLIVLCYWCVLMHASTAAAAVPPTTAVPLTTTISETDEQTNDLMNPSNLSSLSLSPSPSQSLSPPTTPVADVVFTETHLTSRARTNASFAKGGLNKHRSMKRDVANVPEEEYDTSYPEDIDDIEALLNNKSAKGKYIGAPCNELKCDANLLHVSCDKETLTCSCERNYPVQLGPIKGCAKPKKLGEQCFYDETCIYNDENSLCVQVRHNALCQCANGFHSVSYTKPTRRVFCTQDLSELSSDLPTLLGVSTGIAVLAGLICMVLHLFSKTKYPRHRNFGDANIPPPILYSNETGIPLTVHSGRPSSRSSIRSTGSIGSYGNRRASIGGVGGGGGGIGGGVAGGGSGAGGSKGILVSTSRTGSRRPSLASVHSTSSSVRSYSMMRFEKEMQQKEIRQEMKLRLARLQQQQQLNHNKPQIIIGEGLMQHGALSRITMATPSPLTPNSLDELLPSVDETQEYPPKSETASSSKPTKVLVAAATLTAIQNVVATTGAAAIATAAAATTTATSAPAAATSAPSTSAAAVSAPSADADGAAAYIGPCSSSTEAL